PVPLTHPSCIFQYLICYSLELVFSLSVFLSVWMERVNAIGIQVIPPYPAVGQSVTLSVTGITGNIRQFDWYKGTYLDASNNILVYIPSVKPPQINGNQYLYRASGLPDASLLISDVQIVDRGNYTVFVQTSSGAEQVSVNLPVQYIPQNTSFSAALNLNVGSCLELQCSVDSFPSNKYGWTLNGEDLKINQSTLHIEEVNLEHQGLFKCEVYNPVTLGHAETILLFSLIYTHGTLTYALYILVQTKHIGLYSMARAKRGRK
uniref:Ig-like domain-containing protein n=1 Tax=Leptobrachium leishanense TaxID=445787 RepID=A0A8C5WF76_9ANUR